MEWTRTVRLRALYALLMNAKDRLRSITQTKGPEHYETMLVMDKINDISKMIKEVEA